MKARMSFPKFLLLLPIFMSLLIPFNAKAQYEDVSLETFYEELSPYGEWIYDQKYGYVWRPDVDQDEFRPYYSNGHWEMTKYGNTWVSHYDWGWAPFHYGRWMHHSRKGWLWIPDTKWGPAWVSWRSGAGYYGWAPLGPGINININIGLRVPDHYWVFVPQASIYYSRFPKYNRYRNLSIYNRTVIIHNTYVINNHRYYAGPRREEISRVTRRPVVVHELKNNRPQNHAGSKSRAEANPYSDRSENYSNNPRPSRSTDNEMNRGRAENRVGTGSQDKPIARTENRQIPASSQRSNRTFDNQEVREGQNNAPGRVINPREPISRSQQETRPEPRIERPMNIPERVQRSERIERPSAEVSRGSAPQNSRSQREEANRNNSPGESERVSRTDSRPARVQ